MLASAQGQPGREQSDFWVEGISTVDVVDGLVLDVSKIPLVVAGTKTFKTVLRHKQDG